jgi:hypothetical protein
MGELRAVVEVVEPCPWKMGDEAVLTADVVHRFDVATGERIG